MSGSVGERLLDVRGFFTPDDRAEHVCVAVPFEVARELPAILVELEFERTGGAVLDLGCQGPQGYVGWSGGARRHYVVSAAWATPGYRPAPVLPGTWEVLVGLHRVPAPGVPYRLRVSEVSTARVDEERAGTPAAPPTPERGPRRALPDLDGRRWLATDLHTHTVHSDGALSIDELAALAVSRGLDALAVTDHNTTSHHPFLAAAGERYGIRLIPGQEVTTDLGHANALGDVGFVDFRRPGAQWQRDVDARGGLLSVNHPLGGDCCWRMSLDRPTSVAEIWHSSWHTVPLMRGWGGPQAWWLSWDPGCTPVGGSDFHRPGADDLPGRPTTWVLTEGDDVLGGIGAGRTAVSRDPTGPVLLRHGDELIALGAEGLLLNGFDRGRRVVRGDSAGFPAAPGPWWLEDEHMAVHALCG